MCVGEELNWEKRKAINSLCLNISGFQLITELVSKHIIGKVILRAIECIHLFLKLENLNTNYGLSKIATKTAEF